MDPQSWTLCNNNTHTIQVKQESWNCWSYSLDIAGILVKFETGFETVGAALQAGIEMSDTYVFGVEEMFSKLSDLLDNS